MAPALAGPGAWTGSVSSAMTLCTTETAAGRHCGGPGVNVAGLSSRGGHRSGPYHRGHDAGPSPPMAVNRNQLPPAALAAVVRGNERRAWVFLWLQSGRTEAAGAALAATIRAFASQAARQSMAQWPDRFWRLVAASPLEGTGQWPE